MRLLCRCVWDPLAAVLAAACGTLCCCMWRLSVPALAVQRDIEEHGALNSQLMSRLFIGLHFCSCFAALGHATRRQVLIQGVVLLTQGRKDG